MNKKYADYFCRQKEWWCNMNNVVINYHHMGEANMMYLIHMFTPKQRIDRMAVVRGCRW